MWGQHGFKLPAVNPKKGQLHLGTGMYVVTISIVDEGHWYTYHIKYLGSDLYAFQPS